MARSLKIRRINLNRYRATGADKKAFRMKAEPIIKSSVEPKRAKSKSNSGKPILPPIMTVS